MFPPLHVNLSVHGLDDFDMHADLVRLGRCEPRELLYEHYHAFSVKRGRVSWIKQETAAPKPEKSTR